VLSALTVTFGGAGSNLTDWRSCRSRPRGIARAPRRPGQQQREEQMGAPSAGTPIVLVAGLPSVSSCHNPGCHGDADAAQPYDGAISSVYLTDRRGARTCLWFQPLRSRRRVARLAATGIASSCLPASSSMDEKVIIRAVGEATRRQDPAQGGCARVRRICVTRGVKTLRRPQHLARLGEA